jgi:hypothetical protein
MMLLHMIAIVIVPPDKDTQKMAIEVVHRAESDRTIKDMLEAQQWTEISRQDRGRSIVIGTS